MVVKTEKGVGEVGKGNPKKKPTRKIKNRKTVRDERKSYLASWFWLRRGPLAESTVDYRAEDVEGSIRKGYSNNRRDISVQDRRHLEFGTSDWSIHIPFFVAPSCFPFDCNRSGDVFLNCKPFIPSITTSSGCLFDDDDGSVVVDVVGTGGLVVCEKGFGADEDWGKVFVFGAEEGVGMFC